MKISFVIPNRNNLKYFKWAYDSIRKNQGDHEVWICSANDASTDGTAEYYEQLAKDDPYFSYITNPGPDRIGHTILYDRIINELVRTDIAIIYHCDMYLCPGALDAIEKHMYHEASMEEKEEWCRHSTNHMECPMQFPNKKTIVSLTRIEPPLHPPGPEKILFDCGTEPEEFDEEKLLENIRLYNLDLGDHPEMLKIADKTNMTSEGVFAPWAFWVDDFKEVEGHDPLYAPQSKEDSDIFNKFYLNGVEFIQTWEGFVYHMTCRGSRRNTFDKAENIYNDSPEWLAQNKKSHNNFIRKWGHHVLHDKYMKPIVPNKYDIALIIDSKSTISSEHLMVLEPYFSTIYIPSEQFVQRLISDIQPTTSYNISDRIKTYFTSEDSDRPRHDIEVYLHPTCRNLQPLTMLPQILDQGHEEGEFDLEGFDLTVNRANNYLKIPNRV